MMTEAVLLDECAALLDQNVRLAVALAELATTVAAAKRQNWQQHQALRDALVGLRSLATGQEMDCWCNFTNARHTFKCRAAYRALHGVDRP